MCLLGNAVDVSMACGHSFKQFTAPVEPAAAVKAHTRRKSDAADAGNEGGFQKMSTSAPEFN